MKTGTTIAKDMCMKCLFVILLMCSAAHATVVDEARIEGWGKNVTVTVVISGISYVLKTNSDEVEKYNKDDNKDTLIYKFIEEVRYANRRK